jgi:hypothetical protein
MRKIWIAAVVALVPALARADDGAFTQDGARKIDMMQIEQPGLVVMHLVNDALPLAATSGRPAIAPAPVD